MEQTHVPSLAQQYAQFRVRTADQRGRFHGLILLGTMQREPTTAALLIDALQPTRVAFLLTAETRAQQVPAQVAREIGGTCDSWLIPDDDYESADDVYRGLKYILTQWADLPRNTIAADATGGFATMSVGLAKAAHVLGLNTIYVRSDYGTVDGRHRYLPGTQRLEFPPDPYTVFGDLEAAEAQRLYCAHDYAGASRIFTSLEQRVPAPDNHDYRAYATLAGAYAAWDSFDWNTAHTALTTLLAAPVPSELEAHRPRLQAQVHAIQQLCTDNRAWESKPPLDLLADLDSVFPLLGTLHANAQRREAQERYDVAALFHYRCLELMSQHRLATWGILTERPDYRPLRRRIPDLDARYRRVEESIFDNTRGLPHWKGGISLFNGYMLLAALDDPLVHDWNIAQVRERTTARNKSMLAHGFRLITQTEYQEFHDVVSEIFERFFCVIAGDRAAWEHTYQFVDPFVVGE
jgi:CRISPR-associated protein (TIGR02710 family)